MVGKAFLHSPSAFAFYIIFILKGDQHPVSPYNVTPESNIEVMRIKEMITN